MNSTSGERFLHGAHPGRIEQRDRRGPARRRRPGRVAHRRHRARGVRQDIPTPAASVPQPGKTCFVGTIHVGRAPRD